MGKVLFAIVAVLASLALAESLVCNRCPFNLFGVCVTQSTQTCTTNTSVCYTVKSTFSDLPKFGGFSIYGCRNDSTGCDTGVPNTFLGVTYNTNITCCSTDNCNPITINGAPSTKMTFTAAVGAAILASLMGSCM